MHFYSKFLSEKFWVLKMVIVFWGEQVVEQESLVFCTVWHHLTLQQYLAFTMDISYQRLPPHLTLTFWKFLPTELHLLCLVVYLYRWASKLWNIWWLWTFHGLHFLIFLQSIFILTWDYRNNILYSFLICFWLSKHFNIFFFWLIIS